jgi:hypothetical protein
LSDDSNEFQDWFGNANQKELREKAMESSGIPLEIKVRRRLAQLSYRVSRAYYDTDEEKSRELDLFATKRLADYEMPQGQIIFYLDILGECKRSSTHDFFAFAAEQMEDIIVLSAFPLPFFRERITAPPFSTLMGSLKHQYSFPFVTDRIVEVEAAQYNSRKGDNYGDKITHGACEALLLASIHFKEMSQKLCDIERQRIFSPLQFEYAQISKEMPGATPSAIVKKLFQGKMSSTDFAFYPVTFGVPLIVLDDNRGLVATVLRNDGSVEFKGDIPFVLYPYVSENLRNYQRVGAVASFPVVICKYASLADTINILETGTRKVIEAFKTLTELRPETFLEELVLTQIELLRKQGMF